MAEVDRLGKKEGVFDPPDIRFACPMTRARRPHTGTDGVFYELWASGVPPQFALGEALVEQDCG